MTGKVMVIVPPDPIMTPDEISSSYASNDEIIQAWIDAAVSEFDGPDGWLGRSIGPQTLEMRMHCFPRCDYGRIELPYPPIIDVDSVIYTDADGVDQAVDGTTYDILPGTSILAPDGKAWPSISGASNIRIRYRAGYDGTDVDAGGTGDIPQRVKQAVKLMVQQYKSVGDQNLFLRMKRIDGVGERQYVVSDAADKVIANAVVRLLGGLRVIDL